MTDRLLTLAQHPWGRSLLRLVGLPQPMRLKRRDDAFTAQELAGRRVQVITIGSASATEALLAAVKAEGAEPVSDGAIATLIVEATAATALPDLQALYLQVQAALPRLVSGARVLLLATDPDTASAPQAAAIAQAIQGFGRSLAKELGRKGATVNTLLLPARQQPSLAGALRFFGTDRSAYVSGQVLRWGTFSPALASTAERSSDLAADTPSRKPVALVTGAAGGIGAATARRLTLDGYRVLCVDVPAVRDALTALAGPIGGEALPLNIIDGDTPAAIITAAAAYGGIDLLVHNAGITRDRTLARMSSAEWDGLMAVNLAAIFAIDQQLDAEGLLRAGAREICLSSISGIAGNAGQTNYSASKAALIGYVQARSKALQSAGITVNAVAPGFIETAMTRRMPMMIREAGRRLNSLKQGGRPEDVAEAIAFLASRAAQPLSGVVLRVCGQSLLGA